MRLCALILIFFGGLVQAEKCPMGAALCPQGTQLCKTSYEREIGFAGKCAPKGDICPLNSITCHAIRNIHIPLKLICDAYDLSVMSYLTKDVIKSITLRAVHNTLKVTSSYSLPFLYYITDDVVWIVVRGSDNWRDYWNVAFDMQLAYLPDEYKKINPKLASIKFHQGISKLAIELIQDIKKHEQEFQTKKIRFAGHSLGGAIVQLAALLTPALFGLSQEKSHLIDAVITFGAPPITDETGATLIKDHFNEFLHNAWMQIIINAELQPFLVSLLKKEYEFFAPMLVITSDNKGTRYAYLPEPDGITSMSFRKMLEAYKQHSPKMYLPALESLGCTRRLLPSRKK